MGSGSSSQKNLEGEATPSNGQPEGRRQSVTARMVDAEIEKVAKALQKVSSQASKVGEDNQKVGSEVVAEAEKEVVLESFHEETQPEPSGPGTNVSVEKGSDVDTSAKGATNSLDNTQNTLEVESMRQSGKNLGDGTVRSSFVVAK